MTKNTRSITVIREIHARPEAIFPLLVQGKELARWFPTRAETEPVVGGHYMLAFESSDPAKGNHYSEGKYLEVKPNERIRFTWPVENTEVQIDIVQKGDMSEVTLVHSGFAETGNDESFAGHARSWNACMTNLKDLLEGREVKPFGCE